MRIFYYLLFLSYLKIRNITLKPIETTTQALLSKLMAIVCTMPFVGKRTMKITSKSVIGVVLKAKVNKLFSIG